MASSVGVFPLYFRMLSLLYALGVDLLVFMKVFPVLVYATTVLLAVAYADRRLGWGWVQTSVLVLTMTLSAPMLRMSWDLHRQNLGTLLLLLAMYLDLYADLTPRKTCAAILLNSLIGLLQQITLAVATIIPLWSAIRDVRNRRYHAAAWLLVISAVPFVSYELGLLSAGSFFSPTAAFEDAVLSFGGYAAIVSRETGTFFAFFWALFPLALLGHFWDRNLGPWLVLTSIAGLSRILFPWMAMQLTDRWMLFMTIPLIFCSTMSISRTITLVNNRRFGLGVACLLLLFISAQGIGMLGISPLQTRLYPMGYTSLIPSNMVFSTASQPHVEAVLRFMTFANSVGHDAIVITHDPWFYYWSAYSSRFPVISFTSAQGISEAIEKARTLGYSEAFVVWLDSLPYETLLRESGLALYRVNLTGALPGR
jgi:hypothetical protein